MLGIIPASSSRSPQGSTSLGDRLDSTGGTASSDEDAMTLTTSLKPKKEGALKRFQHSFKAHKHSSRKDKEKTTVRELIPARFIRTTSVQNKTLNPVWNEKFLLLVVISLRFFLSEFHSWTQHTQHLVCCLNYVHMTNHTQLHYSQTNMLQIFKNTVSIAFKRFSLTKKLL